MTARSHLCPSIAAVTTWPSAASKALTAAAGRLSVDGRRRPAEEVEDAEAGLGAHGVRLRAGLAWPSSAYTLKRSPRTKPTSVRPARRAAWTASAVGALTATSEPKPAAQAFCTISTEARPLTNSPRPVAGSSPASSIAPTTLSTALWRPTSSRVSSTVPSRSKAAAAWTAPVLANRPWPLVTRRRHARHHRSVDRRRSSAAGARRSSKPSIWSLPHQPQLDDVVPSRGVGVGARPPVSTVTSLNALAMAGPLAQ